MLPETLPRPPSVDDGSGKGAEMWSMNRSGVIVSMTNRHHGWGSSSSSRS